MSLWQPVPFSWCQSGCTWQNLVAISTCCKLLEESTGQDSRQACQVELQPGQMLLDLDKNFPNHTLRQKYRDTYLDCKSPDNAVSRAMPYFP